VAPEPSAYRSRDGRASVQVLFALPRQLEGAEGETLFERNRNFFIRSYEKVLDQPVTGAKLVPFESARGGAWSEKTLRQVLRQEMPEYLRGLTIASTRTRTKSGARR
jgi:hypothetical protein